MSNLAIDLGRRYTWDDYRSWDDDKRWEIISGEAFDMSAAPSVRHQDIAMALSIALGRFMAGRRCRVLAAPTDVKLSEEDIVQPDLLVVCDSRRVQATHIEGAPTLVVEILSPATALHDHVRKFKLYERFGVEEYWIVTPYPPMIEVYRLVEGRFSLAAGYEDRHTLRSPAFPELAIPLAGIFDFPIAPESPVEVVRESTPPYAAGAPRRGR